MENILNFLIKVGKLREVKRRGMTFYRVKNPPNAGDHTFRMAIMTWILGQRKKFDITRALKMVLIHDLCKVYTGDITPYDGLLPKDEKEIYKFASRWRRLPLKEKKKRYDKKFKKEYKGFKKLISDLPQKLKKEMEELWLDYYHGKSKEARFVAQIDIVENLLEALEWYKKDKKFPTRPWWEHAEEEIEDPILLNLLKGIENKIKKENEIPMNNILGFFLEIGKLRGIPRRGWVLIGAKNPQTIGEHMFRVAIMSWVFGKEKKVNFDRERLFKIALVHDLGELYAGDTTPYDYDSILPKDKKKWPELFDKWPRFSKAEKKKYFLQKHNEEETSLNKLTSGLRSTTKEEILDLWQDYEYGRTREARFVKQVNRIETLLQALEYGRESNTRPYKSWWIGSEEKVDDPLLVKFMEELERKFYKKNKVAA